MLMAGQSVGISLVPWRDGMSSDGLSVGCVSLGGGLCGHTT